MDKFQEIQQINQDRGNLILKSFGVELEKARSGIYQNTSENRKLGRVGQKYGGKKEEIKTDKSGNLIGSGEYHSDYTTYDFKEYPEISHKVVKSNTTESVYVTYYNKKNDKKITVRFSEHENNATKFGDQLNGNNASKDEILYHLGLKDREFIPNKYLRIYTRSISKKDVKNYEEADKTIKELYELGKDADLSKYKGKVAKGSNRLIEGGKIEEMIETRQDILGRNVKIGKFIYKDK